MSRLALALALAAALPGAGEPAGACEPLACEPLAPGELPGDHAALAAWLVAGSYREWPPQSELHATSEHGGAREFFNPALAASTRAGATEHPVGAAAVRELYEEDLATLRGWAVMRKTGPSQDGAGWYFFEVFATSPGLRPTVAGAGAPHCVACHAGGVDFVQPIASVR